MLIVDKGDYLVIPVYSKEQKKIIEIKNTRFNPIYHEMLEDGYGTDGKIQNMHKDEKLVITNDLIDQKKIKKRGRPKKSN